jgi:hypothetical protein
MNYEKFRLLKINIASDESDKSEPEQFGYVQKAG